MQPETRLRRRLKLRDLDTFVTVAQTGSMAKAAVQLAVSQPAVSQAIAHMERTIGVPLFDRLAQGVEPTIYGRALLKWAGAVFDDVHQGMKEIEFLADPMAGELRIGATEPMIAGILPAIVARLCRTHPRIVLQVIHIAAGPQYARELRERRFDVFLGRVMDADKQEDLAAHTLFDEPLFVAAGTRNPLLRRRKIKLAAVARKPWALPQPDSVPGRFLRDIFHAHGLETPDATVVTNSIHMQHELLADGRFVTLFSRSVLHFGAKRMSIRVLPIKLPILAAPVGIVTLKHRTISPVAQIFIETAREIARPLAKRK